MVFSSVTFLFYFLPTILLIVFLGHLLLRPFASDVRCTAFINTILLTGSLAFYCWGEKERVWILLTTILLTYLSALVIEHGTRQGVQRTRVIGLWLGLLANGSFLLWFKYSFFAYQTLAPALSEFWIQDSFRFPESILPLGISFYTFQLVSYILDVYWRRTPATTNLLNFSCYVTFFPQLVAGPIVRFNDVRQDMNMRRICLPAIVLGTNRFIVGLAKKVLVANPVGKLADDLFAMPPEQLSTGGCWLACIAYGVQILFDFSGYSDMAIGLAKILGIDIPENFRDPYKTDSVRAFWRNWHISLSSWFRDYLYIPLGGGRKSALRKVLNLNLVFIACGLWHGASLTFLAWGLYHGIFITIEHFVGQRLSRYNLEPPKAAKRLYALLAVFLGWVLFRSDSLTDAFSFYRFMLVDLQPLKETNLPLAFYSLEIQIPLLFGLLTSTLNMPVHFTSDHASTKLIYHFLRSFSLLTLLALSAIYTYTSSYNPFIYFRF